MFDFYTALRDRAKHEQSLRLIDADILLCSTSYHLVDFTVAELLPVLPLPEAEAARRFVCILENTQAVLAIFPEIFAEYRATGGKDLHSPELGEAILYHRDGGMMIEVKGIGIFHHDGKGNFLILVDSNSLASSEGRLNIQGLLNLLLSEVLLLFRRFLAHAGGSGDRGQCRLWTGNSGAGKTTRTLQEVSRGRDFYGDDQVIIGKRNDGLWYAWPFWRAVKVTADSWRRLADLPFLEAACPETTAKHVMYGIAKDLAVTKPECGRITSINLLLPDGRAVLRSLSLEEAIRLVAPCFLHALLPLNAIGAIESLLDLFSEVEVRAVSRDMLQKIDESAGE